MRQVITWFAACLFVVSATGCSAAAVEPAKPPPQPVDPQTRIDIKDKEPEALPRLIAPPPGYGNKIVMARRAPVSNSF